MNFIEASEMKEGTKFTLKEYDTTGYLYFEGGTVYSNEKVAQHANINLINACWEVVEEHKTLWDKKETITTYKSSGGWNNVSITKPMYNDEDIKIFIKDIKHEIINLISYFQPEPNNPICWINLQKDITETINKKAGKEFLQ